MAEMASLEELKHMVMSFRVSELQVLLGHAGRNKSGRKQELMARAVQLVEKGIPGNVQMKIRELYRQIYATNQRRRLDAAGGMVPVEPQQQMVNTGMAALGALDYSSKNLASSVGPLTSPIPVHPDVRLKRLPFYDILGELQKPTSLVPKNTNRCQESFFVFHLTPQQAQDIAMSRDFRPGTKCEYTVQVQLRFCLLETSCEQDDNFPPNICVRVNGKMAQLPNPIPTTKPSVEPKRPGRPVDITSICRISPTISNHLEVTWNSEFGRGFCLAVYLVRRLSSDILLQRLKQFGNRHPDYTRALIKEKLALDPDSEVATTSLRVSLICPLGKMRMTIPCRASTCTHLQCFDASTFLMMNEKKPTWICPVCDKPAPYDKLTIDGYFVEIFRQSPETNEIVFHADGSWSPLKQPKEMHVIATNSPITPASKSDSNSTSTSHTVPSHTGNKKGDVIDLTLDSSDEEDDVTVKSASDVPGVHSTGSGPSRKTEAGSSSPAVINLDVPSPALSVHSLSASSSPMAVACPSSQSPFSSPGPSPAPIPVSHSTVSSSTSSSYSMLGAPPPAHTHRHSPRPAHQHPPSTYVGSRGPPPLLAAGPVPSLHLDSTTVSQASLPVPPAPQESLTGLHPPGLPPINLEALSETEFEEFLHGLSWGV